MDKSEKQVYRAFVTLGAEIITDDLYFETLGEYGTKHLAQELQCGVNKQNCPPFEMHIIHHAYIEAVPPGTVSHGRTWEQWLEEVASVRRIPRLKSPRTDGLSTLCAHLSIYQPMTLIGLLKTYWSSLQSDLTPRVIGTLKDMKVPCRNQSQTYLQCTYYPSKEMQRLCADATLQEIFDKFIDIPADIATDGTDGWEFLATFGVKLETEITFFWEIFDALETKANRTILTQAAFFRMYKELFILFSHDPIELKEYELCSNA
jgi:hypothetical protein